MIVIIDYGLGNLGSIANMLSHLSYEAKISDSPMDIADASHLILPGVGHFDHGMRHLNNKNITPLIADQVKAGKPLLGICLGAQLLLSQSAEGMEDGLGFIDGDVKHFKAGALPVPHMGWNKIETKHPAFDNMDEDRRFYFVHSYYLNPANQNHALCTADYGGKFVAGLVRDNVMGVQFHPEKSHRYGMQFFKNYFGDIVS